MWELYYFCAEAEACNDVPCECVNEFSRLFFVPLFPDRRDMQSNYVRGVFVVFLFIRFNLRPNSEDRRQGKSWEELWSELWRQKKLRGAKPGTQWLPFDAVSLLLLLLLPLNWKWLYRYNWCWGSVWSTRGLRRSRGRKKNQKERNLSSPGFCAATASQVVSFDFFHGKWTARRLSWQYISLGDVLRSPHIVKRTSLSPFHTMDCSHHCFSSSCNFLVSLSGDRNRN